MTYDDTHHINCTDELFRVMDEIHWYGWFIDYWMEGGLMRDIFTHQITTVEHWNDLVLKPFYTRAELNITNYVTEGQVVTPSYDPLCGEGHVTDGCEPVAVISVDTLRSAAQGREETDTIAMALMNDNRTGKHVIAPQAWNCIWSELIEIKKGPKIMADRPGYNTNINDFNFSAEVSSLHIITMALYLFII